ncbi:hypothetical protein NYQ25_18570 [Curtobacterium flaccumfaciens pv. flaccumfaciens]|uniref:hypothetical protein n=1 Tax=Curtobacterium flaccumfaciens TaxID=2035 RepID=UPI00217D22CA|nr:hypothetical protein [Curtobacterium flaccumfaciens]MCS6586977.1 hypothetical protein [Curtobacterium flaccumfaciens pv. flaccumfaciens]
MEDIHEMVGMVELSDVYLWEERGRRIEETAAEDDEAPRIRNVLNVAERNDRLGIGFRFRMTVDDRRGNEFLADFQAQYDLPEPVKFSTEVRTEFAERVAFFTTYPYLRASIQMTASRMGVPAPVLAIVRAGEFKLGSPMTEDAAVAEFADTKPEG